MPAAPQQIIQMCHDAHIDNYQIWYGYTVSGIS